MTERELFERAYKWNYPNAELSWCKVTKSYKDPTEMRCWSMWQAATQREGFKFVPVDDTSIMDIIYGKCPCGSSRSPIVSDKQGYNLIHCFSCGANKYIHEDY